MRLRRARGDRPFDADGCGRIACWMRTAAAPRDRCAIGAPAGSDLAPRPPLLLLAMWSAPGGPQRQDRQSPPRGHRHHRKNRSATAGPSVPGQRRAPRVPRRPARGRLVCGGTEGNDGVAGAAPRLVSGPRLRKAASAGYSVLGWPRDDRAAGNRPYVNTPRAAERKRRRACGPQYCGRHRRSGKLRSTRAGPTRRSRRATGCCRGPRSCSTPPTSLGCKAVPRC